jgi:8-oxo-dGTP pyrophosphatase MutT (NUDIX family)
MTVTEHSRHLTASMIILDPRTAKVLLVHHKTMNLWVFPGGHVDEDKNEAPHEAAQREVHEETGLTVEVDGTLGPTAQGMTVYPSPIMVAQFPAPGKPHKGEPAHHHIDLLYYGTADAMLALRPELDEVHSVQWFDLDTLFDLHMNGQSRAEVYGIVSGYVG